MIKKTLMWKDFNGGEHMEDFYFHLYKPDMVDLEVSRTGGLSVMLPKMIASKDMGEVVEIFKKLVRMSLGIRSEDGRKFTKRSPEAREYVNDFMDSPAYAALFDDLTQNENAGAEFLLGMLPEGFLSREDMAAMMENSSSLAVGAQPPAPAEVPWAKRRPTSKELREMTPDQLREVYARDHGTTPAAPPEQ
jgi:hypothetical protein